MKAFRHKYPSLSIYFLFFLSITCTNNIIAQIKVWPSNMVSLGPVWWTTFPSSHNVFVNGSIEFNAYPASSALFIKNYSNSTNDPAIIPQFGNSAWLGIPSYQFYRIYSLELYSNFSLITSDERLKTNIIRFRGDSALFKIRQLKSYTYDFKEESFKNTNGMKKARLINEGKNQIGFLAQELKDVLPQAVRKDDSTGTYSVNYIAIIPILVEAIKEQQKKIEELESILNELKR